MYKLIEIIYRITTFPIIAIVYMTVCTIALITTLINYKRVNHGK